MNMQRITSLTAVAIFSMGVSAAALAAPVNHTQTGSLMLAMNNDSSMQSEDSMKKDHGGMKKGDSMSSDSSSMKKSDSGMKKHDSMSSDSSSMKKDDSGMKKHDSMSSDSDSMKKSDSDSGMSHDKQ